MIIGWNPCQSSVTAKIASFNCCFTTTQWLGGRGSNKLLTGTRCCTVVLYWLLSHTVKCISVSLICGCRSGVSCSLIYVFISMAVRTLLPSRPPGHVLKSVFRSSLMKQVSAPILFTEACAEYILQEQADFLSLSLSLTHQWTSHIMVLVML